MDSNVVKAILFDLDNTLIDTAGAGSLAIQKVCELLQTSLVQEHNIPRVCDQFKRRLLHESYDPSAGRTIDDVRIGHWEEALQEVEGKVPERGLSSRCYFLWKTTRLQHLAISPDVCALLERLRRSHRLLLLTNGEARTQREKIEKIGCRGQFDCVVVGGEQAEEKPAVSIFSHCFALLGVGPQDCVMVGDSLSTDILGGFNAGVHATVWINGGGESPPLGSVKPDYTIPSVLDLPAVLANLNQRLEADV